MLGLRHVAWGLPEKSNWVKRVALILVTIDLTCQYKITSLTWFGTEILCLCGLFSQLTEQILFTRPSYQFITSCCLLWPVQILEETHTSVHSPFVVHDPDTVGTFPVPPDPTGKVSTSLFLIDWLIDWLIDSLLFEYGNFISYITSLHESRTETEVNTVQLH